MACLLQMAHGHQLKKVPYMAAVGGRVIARVKRYGLAAQNIPDLGMANLLDKAAFR